MNYSLPGPPYKLETLGLGTSTRMSSRPALRNTSRRSGRGQCYHEQSGFPGYEGIERRWAPFQSRMPESPCFVFRPTTGISRKERTEERSSSFFEAYHPSRATAAVDCTSSRCRGSACHQRTQLTTVTNVHAREFLARAAMS